MRAEDRVVIQRRIRLARTLRRAPRLPPESSPRLALVQRHAVQADDSVGIGHEALQPHIESVEPGAVPEIEDRAVLEDEADRLVVALLAHRRIDRELRLLQQLLDLLIAVAAVIAGRL